MSSFSLKDLTKDAPNNNHYECPVRLGLKV